MSFYYSTRLFIDNAIEENVNIIDIIINEKLYWISEHFAHEYFPSKAYGSYQTLASIFN